MYQASYIIWASFVVHKCKMMISPRVFFHFFEILIFQVVDRVKRQKMVWNDKKLCASLSISQESYIMWSSLVVHKCKMIFSGVFHFAKILIFGVIKRVKVQKMAQNVKLLHLIYQEPSYISGNIHHIIFIYGT